MDGQDQPPYFTISLRVIALPMNDLYCSGRRGKAVHWSLENLSPGSTSDSSLYPR